MGKYTRGLLAVILAVVLVLPAAAFAMLPEANARSSTGMDGPTVSGPTVVDPDTSGRWEKWAAGHSGNKVTTQNVGRIWTDKTVEATGENEESDFLTTLSAMSSTSNSTVTVTTPLDIVMVLDASGSMDSAMGDTDSTKRITALKNAAYSFIDTIAKQNESIEGVGRQHRVAVIKFSGDENKKIGNDTYNKWEYGQLNTYNYSQVMAGLTDCSGAGATALKNTIKEIKPAGATRADNGLKLAEDITSGRADAKKIVVFFTDGKPTSYSDFDSKVANDAVTAAKNMKDGKATVYTIGIFDGANPSARVQDSKTSQENKFIQAVSSNYPNATAWDSHGARAENSDYYKSATNADELKKVFDDISKAITSEAPHPTEIHKGYDANKSGYITFTDELGDFMQVDGFTEAIINGTPFTKPSKTTNKETNTDTYEFTGEAKNLLITVQRAGDDNPQKGDIVTVSIPAALIPQSHFKKTVDGKLLVDSAQPIRVKYASSVKKVALDNLFTPEKVTGLKDYIERNRTVDENRAKTVNFYANKWAAGALGNTVATFEPADTNRYYYFQKQTPIFTDEGCTKPATGSLTADGKYYYKDEFEEQGENDEAKPATDVIEFIGGDAAKFDGAIVPDENGNLVFTVGTARLAFIDELHTTKESVGGNNTHTASDVLNPKWNNTSAKATATHVNSYLGNNGKISFNVTPATVDTKTSFGLTKVLEGREWTDADAFEFELSATSENDAPMPASTTAIVRKAALDDKGKAAIDFGEITYNKPGEYTYEVREVKGDAGGITYSKNVATFKVTVTVNAKGELKADVEKTSGETEFKNTYSVKPVEDQITATKVLTGRDLKEGEFSFELVEGNKVVAKGTNTADGTIAMDKITYDKPGTHTYTLREKLPNEAGLSNGITYDKTNYTIKTSVIDNGDGTLKVTHTLEGPETARFENKYNTAPNKSSVTDQITATKTLTGRDLKEGEFSFELVEGNDVVARGTNAADGKITMDKITYTAAGEHTYILRETKVDADNGITYSTAAYTIVTTVTDDGNGKLTVKHELQDVEKAIFENAYSVTPVNSSVTDQITATKSLTGRDMTAGEFSFKLVEDGKVVATGKNDADGKIVMDKITYDKAGEHTYILREAKGAEGNGIAYDDKTYTVVTTITDNGKGKLEAKHELKDATTAEFKNSYKPNPGEFSVTDKIAATKVLTGRDMAEGEFSFELVEGEGKDAKVVATGKNAADGKITMSAVKYDKAGTHTYTLREVNGGTTSKGVTYSDAKFTIVTTITDKGDGTLKAEHVLKGDKPATFENTYSVDPIDANLDFGLSKAINGRDWKDSDEFSFTITAPEGAPLPDPATVTVSNKNADDNGIAAIKFGSIRYTAAGTYKYEIRENKGSAAGMKYDEHVATAEVTVTDNGKGVLTANVIKKENGHFTNTYRAELNYTAAGGLKLSKTLSGRPMTEGQFTFTVTPADDASAKALGLLPGANEFKSPATAEGTVGLIDILADHEVKFTQADAGKTFTYTVAEKNDGQPGYTYDDAVRTVTIAIADDTAGTLTATTTVSGGPEGTLPTEYKTGAAAVESAVVPFVNRYSATTGGTAAQVVATKTLTGRPMADGEFYFGIAYAGEKEAIEGTCTTNVNGHVSFGSLHYTTEMLADLVNAKRAIRTDKDAKLTWTIGYTAFEFTPQLAAKGITAATPSFSFKVIVVDNGDGTLTAEPVYDGVKPEFENVYGTDAVDAALAGTKKLQAAEGLTPADIAGKFTFTVTPDEAGAPMPEHATATNDAAGNVDFGKIHFTLEDLNRALGVTGDATDETETDEADADEANADEAETDEADVDVNADESEDKNEPAAATPRSHTFIYTVTESGSAPGVTNDANATRKVSYTVTDDNAGHLSVVREGDDGAAFTFTNTYGVVPTDSVVTDQVKTVKRLIGRDLAAGEFTFELLDEDGVVVASGTNDVNGTVTLSPIRYKAPGTHTYTLREACPNALGLYKGVTYDGTTYTVVTTVSDNGDGTLTAKHKLEGTTESAGFTNKYHAMPTQVSIGAIKVLEGRELKKDEFSFKLVGEDIESTVTNDADGKINFDKFEYDEPGTHVYTISEVKGDEAGMTYDKSVFTATVNVVDDGEGNLKASVAFAKGDKSVEGIVFNNTYKKPETPVPTPDPGTPKTVTNIVKTVKGFLPTTGDQQAAALLMAFVVAMAGVGALIWGIRKR